MKWNDETCFTLENEIWIRFQKIAAQLWNDGINQSNSDIIDTQKLNGLKWMKTGPSWGLSSELN